MVDKSSGICIGCKKRQKTYGNINEKAEYCSDCKKPEMVNMKTKKCKCGKFPSFGFIGGKPINCSDCKIEGMINLKCTMCFCGKTVASFGLHKGKKATHCSSCKEDEMFDVINRR